MKINVVRLELAVSYNIEIDMETEYAYGVESVKSLLLNELSKRNTETVGIVCLDHTNRIINYANISYGGIENVKVHIAELFKTALLSNASKLIIAHNHPSGLLDVTQSDIAMTKNIGVIARLFDMILIDSVIVNSMGNVISIREAISNLEGW